MSLDVSGAEGTKKFQAETSFEVSESVLLACQRRKELDLRKRPAESGRVNGEADGSPPSTLHPKLSLLMMVWKDHENLGLLHGQTKVRRLDLGAREGSQEWIFPDGAEVYFQSYAIEELDALGRGRHSSARGTMRKGVFKNVPGDFPCLRLEENDPGIIWGMEYSKCSEPGAGQVMVSSDQQRRLEKATRDVPYDLHMNVSGAFNALVAIPRPRVGSQIQYHYHFANNTMKKSEIALNYSCPFCVQKHPSFEALKCHLLLCHDLFHYAFHGRGGIGSAVNVTCDPLVHDVEGRLILPEAEVYRVNHINKEFYFYRPRKKKGEGPTPTTVKDVERYHYEVAFVRRVEQNRPVNKPVKMELKRRMIRSMDADEMGERKRKMQRVQGSRAARKPVEAPQRSRRGAAEPPARAMRRSRGPPTQKQGQPSQEGHEAGQVFFHYRSYQPMKEAEAEGGHDSDLEEDLHMMAANDQYLLAEFEDVTQVEKKFMHKWNMFVHDHRIIADSMTFVTMKQFVEHMKDTLVEDMGFRRCMSMHLINFWDRGIFSSREVKLVLQQVDTLGQQVAAQGSQ